MNGKVCVVLNKMQVLKNESAYLFNSISENLLNTFQRPHSLPVTNVKQ